MFHVVYSTVLPPRTSVHVHRGWHWGVSLSAGVVRPQVLTQKMKAMKPEKLLSKESKESQAMSAEFDMSTPMGCVVPPTT